MERSKVIQKFHSLIVNAIRTGGGPDPDLNVRLASAIGRAKDAGISKTSVESAIRQASSKQECGELVLYEGRSDAGYVLVIETMTSNKNRTRPELKKFLMKYK